MPKESERQPSANWAVRNSQTPQPALPVDALAEAQDDLPWFRATTEEGLARLETLQQVLKTSEPEELPSQDHPAVEKMPH